MYNVYHSLDPPSLTKGDDDLGSEKCWRGLYIFGIQGGGCYFAGGLLFSGGFPV